MAQFVDKYCSDDSAEFAVWTIAEVGEGIKDPLVSSLLVKLLKHSNPGVVRSALISLGNQEGDEALLAQVISFLHYEHKEPAEQQEVRQGALIALEGLLREKPEDLKRILSEQNILSPDSIINTSKEITSKLEGLAWSGKRDLFRGDEEQKLNTLLREQASKVNLADALEKLARLMYHESLIPHSEFQLLLGRCESLEKSAREITWSVPEAFWITRWNLRSFANLHVVKKEERQIKESDSLGEWRKRLIELLHSKGFAVSSYFSDLLARSGEKTVLLTSETAPGKKVWKDITLRLCGEWKEEETSTALAKLWESIDPHPRKEKRDYL